MNCLNCNALNPPGVDRCVACRIPGDFGKAPAPVATVITPQHVSCNNCAGHAPVTAKNCPTCRWPMPERIHEEASTASHKGTSTSASAKTSPPLGIQYRRAG